MYFFAWFFFESHPVYDCVIYYLSCKAFGEILWWFWRAPCIRALSFLEKKRTGILTLTC
jgi:hypothetical protein